ncbi:MAG TPA: LCP family protein [Tepidiformaceae bacterium]|nr:LCP family protein [Tepidiformaceae bacterium]
MASRIDGSRGPVPGRGLGLPRAGVTRGTRFLFSGALLFLSLTSAYTSLALLARITPALFPGQTLEDVLPNALPTGGIAKGASADSVFNRRINLLVMGIDTRPDQLENAGLTTEERYAGRTDTLMVASVDPVTKSTNFLSFPRDLVIDVYPEKGRPYKTRINESFLEGLQRDGKVESGAEQVERDLQKNFGIELDYWVLLDFRGVEKLVDAVGGVDVDVPEELAIPGWWYSDDDKDHKFITIDAGRQHLDGYMAVAFSRNRDPNDLARIQRQQLVLQAAIAKSFAQGLLSPSRWPGLWSAYKDTVQTDVPSGRLPGYANLLRSTSGRINTFSIGDPVGGRATVWDGNLGGAAVLYWDPDNVRYWIARTFPKAAYAEATVEVRNALGPDGESRALAIGRFLEYDKALPTVYIGPPEEAAQSEIVVYGESRMDLAKDIAHWLDIPVSQIRQEPRDDDKLPDVVLIVGADVGVPTSPQASAGAGNFTP